VFDGKERNKRDVGQMEKPDEKHREEPIELVLEVLNDLNYRVRQGNNGHFVAPHPKLHGAPFGLRALTISAHVHGKPGWVSKSAINQIVQVIEIIEEND
jgi:hypothetical protein